MNVNEQENDILEVEVSIKEYEEAIALMEALDRLQTNKDFDLVITEGLFKEESARAVILRADPMMQSESEQKNVNDIITTIGGMWAYFSKIYGLGQRAKDNLASDETTKEELLAEQIGAEVH